MWFQAKVRPESLVSSVSCMLGCKLGIQNITCSSLSRFAGRMKGERLGLCICIGGIYLQFYKISVSYLTGGLRDGQLWRSIAKHPRAGAKRHGPFRM